MLRISDHGLVVIGGLVVSVLAISGFKPGRVILSTIQIVEISYKSVRSMHSNDRRKVRGSNLNAGVVP
jgi:hypothetical protein